jgi:hypothetical protein
MEAEVKKRTKFNPKRAIDVDCSKALLDLLLKRVKYGGNPEHKRNPQDFGLTPPSNPRPDKSLCDTIGSVTKGDAVNLLRKGVEHGLVSKRCRGKYPQNIWSVTEDGLPVESQLENSENGTYHGYPMPESDPFRKTVLEHWKQSNG